MAQKEKVLSHLEKYGVITSWEAIQRYRITRLAAIIKLLRDDGYQIDTEMLSKKVGDETVRYAKYIMMKGE